MGGGQIALKACRVPASWVTNVKGLQLMKLLKQKKVSCNDTPVHYSMYEF